MTGPFIFIATNRLKQRKLASEKERLPDFIDFIHTNEPRLIAFNEYANPRVDVEFEIVEREAIGVELLG